MILAAGSTSVVSAYFKLLLTDGTEATGLVITDCDLQYVRAGAAPAAKVDATALASTSAAFTANAGIEIDATDQPGVHRFDFPDAAYAAGVASVVLTVKAPGCKTADLRVELTPSVNVAAVDGVILADKGAIPSLGIADFGTAQAAASGSITLRSDTLFTAIDVNIGQTIWFKGTVNAPYWQSAPIDDFVVAPNPVVTIPTAGYVVPSGTIKYWIGLTPRASTSVLTPADVRKINQTTVQGTGVSGDLWRG